MANKWIVIEKQLDSTKYNAGSKARTDIESILLSEKFTPLKFAIRNKFPENVFAKIINHVRLYYEWKKTFTKVNNKDIIVIQYPILNQTIFFNKIFKKLKKKDVFIVGIIHDLESLRLAISPERSQLSKFRLHIEEVSAMKYFDTLIVHNEKMKNVIHQTFNFPYDHMISIGIFDYLYKPKNEKSTVCKNGPIIIAGNLKKSKSGYIYELPENIRIILYGANYDANKDEPNIDYRGKVDPNELPGLLNGSFGLIWDGPSTNTCEGVYGEYLKYNNPHKTSLFLAAGLPVIVWEEAAIAEFIKKNNCGILIDSLNNISNILPNISEKEYKEMVKSVDVIRKKIINGEYIKKALNSAMIE